METTRLTVVSNRLAIVVDRDGAVLGTLSVPMIVHIMEGVLQ